MKPDAKGGARSLRRWFRRGFSAFWFGRARGTAEALVASADAARDSGDPAKAATLYRVALARLPDRDDLHVQLGNMLKDAGQFREAVEAYAGALALRVTADTHLQLGRAFRLAGEVARARVALLEASRLDPEDTVAVIELAKLPLQTAQHASSAVRGQGAVEHRDGECVTGFAFNAAEPGKPLEIEVLINGDRLKCILADIPRPDLTALCPGLVGGGFRLCLPPGLDGATVELQMTDGATLAGGAFCATTSARRHLQAYAMQRAMEGREIAVVLVLDSSSAVARADIEALLQATATSSELRTKLILVEPDEAKNSAVVVDLFEERSHNIVHLVAHPGEAAVALANRAILAAQGKDLVWLAPGARVGPSWLGGLRAAAYARAEAAGAGAVSAAEGPFALLAPADDPLAAADPSSASHAAAILRASRLVRHASGAHLPDLPAVQSSCFYYRADALAEIGFFEAEVFHADIGAAHLDWCLRAFLRGRPVVLDDRTYASPARAAGSDPAMLPDWRDLTLRHAEFDGAADRFASNIVVSDVRRRLVGALRSAASAESTAPRALFVVSTLTGGTPLTNRDLMGGLEGIVEPWLLHCDGRTLRLFRAFPENDRLEDSYTLANPIAFAPHRSSEYDEIVWTWLLRRHFEIVHIRHLAWHGLALPRLASGLGIPVVLSFHDFYAVCPTVKLIDGEGRHCGGLCTDGSTPCEPDLWPGAAHPPLKHRFVHQWRANFAHALLPCSAFVTTSASARDLLIRSLPQLEVARFALIPHGRDFPLAQARDPSLAYAGGRKLRLLTIGNLTPAKGRDLIEALLEADRGAQFEVHVLGECDLPDRPGLHRHGPFRRDDLPALLNELNADIGLVLSIWPETWCHALTEMWAAGLPAVTLDFGATAERVRGSGAGWVLERPDPQLLLDLLSTLVGAPERLSEAAEAARAWCRGEGARLTTAAMAARYGELYVEIGAKLDIAGTR